MIDSDFNVKNHITAPVGYTSSLFSTTKFMCFRQESERSLH